MMFRIPKICRQNEGGFMLMEMLIAIAITGIIVTGIATMIFQILSVKAMSANTITVTKQVESALHYLIRDVQMSQSIAETETEWLVLEWAWDDGHHRVAYEIEADKLYRNHAISGLPEARTLVAQYIDTGLIDWELAGENSTEESVKITIGASVGGYKPASETRTIQVAPRVTPDGELR